jgi:hypothetical protein
MALNLVRNSKVFFTTNLDTAANGYRVKSTGFTAANTFELQVLDGFSFSQNTNNDKVTIAEAGVAPVRGERSFNTSLAPVDFSFSSYIRPFNSGTAVTAEESVLWNALFSDQDISSANTISVGGTVSGVTYAFANGVGTVTIAGTSLTATNVSVGDIVVLSGLTGAASSDLVYLNAAAKVTAISGTAITADLVNPKAGAISGITSTTVKLYKSAWAPAGGTSYSLVTSGGSNKNQLQRFGLIFLVDQVAYAVDNSALNQVVIDFGLDAIATAAWTGQATQLRQIATGATAIGGAFGGGTLTGNFTVKNTSAQYITNKLSTIGLTLVNPLVDNSGSTVAANGTAYTLALTGGSITISNNISFITPANLGTVNLPITYYTGTRSITGTIDAYLKTGTGVGGTGQLLADMLAAASVTIEPMFALQLAIGGSGNSTKVTLDLPSVTIGVPTVNVQQVVSTAINFTGQGYVPSTTAGGNVYDLTQTNDIAIRYYA